MGGHKGKLMSNASSSRTGTRCNSHWSEEVVSSQCTDLLQSTRIKQTTPSETDSLQVLIPTLLLLSQAFPSRTNPPVRYTHLGAHSMSQDLSSERRQKLLT